MSVGTLTSKGQTTIPKEIRDHLGLKPGDKVRFLIEDQGRVLVLPATYHLKDLKGMLKPAPRTVTIEEMEAAIADEAGKP